jgi:hypothetical protein
MRIEPLAANQAKLFVKILTFKYIIETANFQGHFLNLLINTG